MKKTIYKYVKFEPKTGLLRMKTVSELKAIGVIEMPRPFLYTQSPHLSNVYGIVLDENADIERLELYIEEQYPTVISIIDDETMKVYIEEYSKMNISNSELHFFI